MRRRGENDQGAAKGGQNDKEAARSHGKLQDHGRGGFLCCRWLGRCELQFRGGSLEVCVCLCVCHVHVSMRACLYVDQDQKTTSGVRLLYWLTKWLDWWPSRFRDPPVSAVPALELQMCASTPGFSTWVLGLKLRPSRWCSKHLLSEPSPQLLPWNFEP